MLSFLDKAIEPCLICRETRWRPSDL